MSKTIASLKRKTKIEIKPSWKANWAKIKTWDFLWNTGLAVIS